MDNNYKNLRDQVKTMIAGGDYGNAIQLQEKLLELLMQQQTLTTDEVETLCYLNFSSGNYSRAYDVLNEYIHILPENARLYWNRVTILYMQHNYKLARDKALEAIERFPDFEGANDIIARIFGALGLMDETKHYGEAAMLARDKLAFQKGGEVYSLPDTIPAFNEANSNKNIIAYSLWGDNDRYLENAIKNAEIKNDFYPDWTLRFYIEEGLKQSVVDRLLKNNAQIVTMPKQKLLYEGLFWRFMVVNDPSVDYFLIRDADSLFSKKETAAVQEWLDSGKFFHVMRDHFEQTDLIQAGLWGGVGQVLPPIGSLLSKFKFSAPSKMVDQAFLNIFIWPTIKQNVLIHDSLYKVFNAQDYPVNSGEKLGFYQNK